MSKSNAELSALGREFFRNLSLKSELIETLRPNLSPLDIQILTLDGIQELSELETACVLSTSVDNLKKRKAKVYKKLFILITDTCALHNGAGVLDVIKMLAK